MRINRKFNQSLPRFPIPPAVQSATIWPPQDEKIRSRPIVQLPVKREPSKLQLIGKPVDQLVFETAEEIGLDISDNLKWSVVEELEGILKKEGIDGLLKEHSKSVERKAAEKKEPEKKLQWPFIVSSNMGTRRPPPRE